MKITTCKKTLTTFILMTFSSVAMAINPAALLGGSEINNTRLDMLKQEQQNYQNLIKEQARDETRVRRLTYRLQRAEKKLAKAQFNVNKLRAELMLTRDIQQRQAAELKAAGERLNRAWHAAYGSPNYRLAGKR